MIKTLPMQVRKQTSIPNSLSVSRSQPLVYFGLLVDPHHLYVRL